MRLARRSHLSIARSTSPLMFVCFFAVLAAMAEAASPPAEAPSPFAPLEIRDEGGRPIAGAAVDFVDERGSLDPEQTDLAGPAAPAARFAAVAAQIRKAGFESLRVEVRRNGELARLVRLVRVLPIVGSVTVATGTLKSLHDVPLATSVIDRSTIALAQTTSVDRLLRALPGFDRTAATVLSQITVSFARRSRVRETIAVRFSSTASRRRTASAGRSTDRPIPATKSSASNCCAARARRSTVRARSVGRSILRRSHRELARDSWPTGAFRSGAGRTMRAARITPSTGRCGSSTCSRHAVSAP